jgi:hypothetical protein
MYIIGAAALLVSFVASANQTQNPTSAFASARGNNGTVKIHEGSTENEGLNDKDNEPHVCTFHIHGFTFDSGQSDTWEITNQAPNLTPFTLDGSYTADSHGEWKTGVINTIPDGHYKLVVEGVQGAGKQKVIWIDCGGTTITPTPTYTSTPTPTCTPTPTVTPTETVTPTPTLTCTGNDCIVINCPGGGTCEVEIGNTPTPTVTPTATPSTTITPTPTNSGGTGGTSSNTNNTNSNNSPSILSAGASTTAGEVLGANTFANTGTFAASIMNILFALGAGITGLAGIRYVKESK